MSIHASCAARGGAGVLVVGPPGSGKSDLVLRLLDRGFTLVADDQVDIELGFASPPAVLAGLLEVRGLGIMRMTHVAPVRLAVVVELIGAESLVARRMPAAERHPELGLPVVAVAAADASAALRVEWALDCATGRRSQVAGAFA
jgi:HPr kinase/phosphorylase